MKTRKTSWTVRASTELNYPVWVCQACGELHGKRQVNPNATWHAGDNCGLCGIPDSVTEPRDFGHLKDGWQNHKRAKV